MVERRIPRIPPAPDSRDVYSDPLSRLGLATTTRGALAQVSLRRATPPLSRRPQLMKDAPTVPDRLRVIDLNPFAYDRLTHGDFDPRDEANSRWMNSLGIFLNQGDVTLRVGPKTHVMDTSEADFGTLKAPKSR